MQTIESPTAEQITDSQNPLTNFREEVREGAFSVVERTEDFHRRHAEFERWADEVREPAENAAEGVRRIVSREGRAYAEYVIAALPDGRFALRTDWRISLQLPKDAADNDRLRTRFNVPKPGS